jgi:nucleoside-diphosphate kinase
MERTFIMAKPDALQRGLVYQVLKRFENRGFKLVAMKLVSPPREVFEAHYEHLKGREFFERLMAYMTGAPVCAMVWEGVGAVAEGRKILGGTYPEDWTRGSIRGTYCMDVERCMCHASDTVPNAEREIALWFPEGVLTWTAVLQPWLVR